MTAVPAALAAAADLPVDAAALNPPLWAAVCAALDHPRVVRPGEPLEGYHTDEPGRDGVVRTVLKVVRWGEMYAADCPFCGDTRGRLSVSHRYGVRDDRTARLGRTLWRCVNEECQNDKDYRRRLWEDLTLPRARLARVAPPPVVPVRPSVLAPCEFPGVLAPLDALPADHPVVAYVRGRGFDPAELAGRWGVGAAEHVPARSRVAMVQGRLVAPVVMHGVQVGWQARFPGELDWKAAGVPKYLHFFQTSLALYGLDAVGAEPAVALFEGVTDVWRYGPGGVSAFGKAFSPVQALLLAAALAGRPLVLVPDMDDPKSLPAFVDSAVRLGEAGCASPVAVCRLPDGRDPAGLSRGSLRRLVERAARDARPFGAL